METICQSNRDLISEVPECIVTKILECLSIQDAVRTSVLSKNWRYAWTKVTQLVFDDMFCDESIINSSSKLIMAIYQVLLLHHGPLYQFRLSLSNLKACRVFDQFTLVALKAGVKCFVICIHKGQPYRLPSSVFAYGQQLETLGLQACVFKPPLGFEGFSKLKKLVLWEVGIDGSTLSNIISNCPLLEYLDFKSSTNCGCIYIDSPNLWGFCFDGLCESLCFKNTPNLERVGIFGRCIKEDALGEREESTRHVLCGSLPVIEKLAVDQFYLKNFTPQAPLLNDLCRLEILELRMCFDILHEVTSALCLIKYAKELEMLVIRVSNDNNAHLNLLDVEGFSDVTLDHLKEVNLHEVSGSKSELQFIRLILAKSPVLERFVIEPDLGLVGEKGWSFFQELSIFRRASSFFKELSRFRRASPLVEISYES